MSRARMFLIFAAPCVRAARPGSGPAGGLK